MAGLEVLRSKLDDDHSNVQTTIERLITLYEAWDKPDEAEEYRELLIAAEPADTFERD